MGSTATPDPCTGPGDDLHDVGITGLALLAFLGDGNTLGRGRYRDVVSRGVYWLRSQQDVDNGLIGEAIGHTFLYDHAIASLALGEAYYFSRSVLLKGTVQSATLGFRHGFSKSSPFLLEPEADFGPFR